MASESLPDDLLGAIAVVHIDIDDRHSLSAMQGNCVKGSCGDVVEDAESARRGIGKKSVDPRVMPCQRSATDEWKEAPIDSGGILI